RRSANSSGGKSSVKKGTVAAAATSEPDVRSAFAGCAATSATVPVRISTIKTRPKTSVKGRFSVASLSTIMNGVRVFGVELYESRQDNAAEGRPPING